MTERRGRFGIIVGQTTGAYEASAKPAWRPTASVSMGPWAHDHLLNQQ